MQFIGTKTSFPSIALHAACDGILPFRYAFGVVGLSLKREAKVVVVVVVVVVVLHNTNA